MRKLTQRRNGAKKNPRSLRSCASPRLGVKFLAWWLGALVVPAAVAANPAWWSAGDTKIIDDRPGVSHAVSENYTPANLGQLKNVAKKARQHLDLKLPGGAGTEVAILVAGFANANPADNYAPINLGQLKAVAKPFYGRLLVAGYNTKANLIAHGYPANWAFDYPWNPATPPAQNYAPASLGQLKMAFSFDLTGFTEADTNQNGLPDSWETAHGLPLAIGGVNSDGNADTDGDGVSDYDEYLLGLNPSSAYSNGGGSGGSGGGPGGSAPSDGDLDSDGDGKKNAEDAYPADERRTEDVAPVNYALIDLGKDVIPADKEVDQIAIGEDGRVAYSWRDGNDYKVAKWKDGQLVEPAKAMASEVRGSYRANGIIKTYTETVAIEKAAVINSNGDVIRPIEGDPFGGGDQEAIWKYGEVLSVLGLSYTLPRFTTVAIDGEHYLLESGTAFVVSFHYGSEDVANSVYGPAGGILKIQQSELSIFRDFDVAVVSSISGIDNVHIAAASRSGIFGVVMDDYGGGSRDLVDPLYPTDQSNDRHISLLLDPAGIPTTIKTYVGPYTGPYTPDTNYTPADYVGSVAVVNDNKDFILAGSGDGKFVFYKAATKVKKLEELLPEKYGKQIRWDAPPAAGQTAATSTSKMLALSNSGKLLFTMECLEGRGRPDTWVKRTFVSDPITP